MIAVLIVIGALFCAVQAVRTHRLLHSALWLAGTSALTALFLYFLGAPNVAVVELSVGAGLVTVLFVFAINIAGEEPMAFQALIPRPVAWVLVLAAMGLLAVLVIPRFDVPMPPAVSLSFSRMLWENRGVDVVLQMALIFCGVLGVIGLLADGKTASEKPVEERQ